MAFRLVRPATVDEAIRFVGGPDGGSPIAGGTDLLLDLQTERVAATRLVSLARLPWRTLRRGSGELTIGSTLPLRRLEVDPRLPKDLPGLYEAVRAIGSVALRHRATMGGNLARASPSSDLLPVLLALEAIVRVTGPRGARDVALDEFLRGSRSVDLERGELIESVRVPETAPSSYVWQRVRPANDISQVGVAVARPAGATGWRVAIGGIVPRPARSPRAEARLGEARPAESQILEAARIASEDATFETDRRASEGYRRSLVTVLVRRALERATAAGGR